MKEVVKKIWSWIEKNRFTVVVPLLGLIVWLVAMGCQPEVISPVSGKMVNASVLKIDYDKMLAEFAVAAEDLEWQYERQNLLMDVITQLATGQVASGQGLISLILGGGGLGLIFDNRRKNTVIQAMKRGQQNS